MSPDTPDPPVDEFDLELQMAGADLDPAVLRALERAEHLAPARRSIASMRRWWIREAPPWPHRVRSPWRPAAPFAAAVAMAAALLLVLADPWTDRAPYRARGEATVDWGRIRGDAPLEATEPTRAGDHLFVALIPDADRYVSVATLQADGAVSLHVVSAAVAAGQDFSLPGRIALDDYGGREWLVVLANDRPAHRGPIEAQIRAMLPNPGAHADPAGWTVEVTRGTVPGAPR